MKKTKHLQVFISAENKEQAEKILDSLLKKKLVAVRKFSTRLGQEKSYD